MPQQPKNTGANEVAEMGLELEKYQRIVENASDAVVTINQNHEVVYMNAAAERMFGFSRGEILGGDVSPLLCPEHRERHRHYVERFVKTGRARVMGHTARLTATRKDRSQFPIAISFSVASADGQPLFTAIMRDLTEQEDLAEEVRRAQNLALVGQMVATVTHEIRTPLSLIGGFARQLASEKGLSEKGERKRQIIVQEVARLEAMLNDLNDLSRPQKFQWEEVDLGQLAHQVVELMAPTLKKVKAKVKIKAAPGLPLVAADRNRLSQVLINLINNAVQADENPPRIQIDLSAGAEARVLLIVSDSGMGIPEEKLKSIFKPFYTTKPRGTGLGLPVAKRIVAEHGGKITAHSKPGEGASFHILLPGLGGGAEDPPPAKRA